ncbi:hypothetical protein LC040_08535 [Bacillus tianshenii]|nr:hypothetical protein LC040_08535 [Bacillus tianshenii]
MYKYRNPHSAVEKMVNELEDQIKSIFVYMDSNYNAITNEGENYLPEVHDQIVAKLASEKFGITPKEAGDIYVDVQIKIGDMYK